ncbi:MAG TPA: DUF695 domain-containing protein [Mucilaginibacter sp.]|jgi:hypothetical protein
MKNLNILPVIIFLIALFDVKTQNDIYPKENFSVVEAHLNNGKTVIGSINMAYKNYSGKANYPWCLTINIALDLKNVTKNGLPSKSESDVANKLEDDLLNSVRKIAVAHYIGHLYNDSFLDIYIYLDSPKKVHEFLQTQINKKGLVRGFAYEIKKDPNWETVNGFFR